MKKKITKKALARAAKQLGMAVEDITCEVSGHDKKGNVIMKCVPKTDKSDEK